MEEMVFATEETKKTLQMECDEAKYALKPWSIETMVTRPVNRSTCICEEEMNTEARAEEIAAEIGKTLMQSQQLREKLAANLQKERQNARKPDVHKIYTSAFKKNQPLRESNVISVEKEKNTRNSRRSLSQQRPTSSESKRSSSSQGSKTRSASISKGRNVTDENTIIRRSLNKTSIKPSKDNLLAQLTGYQKSKPQTNFILANKLNVKNTKPLENIRQVSKSQVDLRKIGIRPLSVDKSTSTSTDKNDEVETLSELDRLIKKFAAEATIKYKDDCPVHGNHAVNYVEEKVLTSVDAVEGLDRFGVPSGLVKVFKTYHAYLQDEVLKQETNDLRKQEEAANTFLVNFEIVSKKKEQSYSNHFRNLLKDYSALLRDSHKPNLRNHEIKLLKKRFLSFESVFNECNVKSTVGELTLVRSQSDEFGLESDMSNWISNGVWNYHCIPRLKGIFGTHCTWYSNRNQLMLFQEQIQKVQKQMYEIELIDLLMQIVIPKLKEYFEPGSKEFIDTYKMIVTVAQIINPKVPVLAKTDDD